MDDLKKKSLITKAIHGGSKVDKKFGAVSTPIYQSSTFLFDSADQGAARFKGVEPGYIYTRLANPTILALEENVTILENGFGAIATSSGMAAVTSVYMTILEAGAHMIGTAAVYGTSRGVIENDFAKFGVESTFVDTSDIEAIKKSIKKNTKLLFIETPANPTIVLTDLKKCVEIAKENNLILAVDNTFATPLLQRPLELGADISFHSVTKAINGHTDVVGGIIISRTEEMHNRIKKTMQNMGCCMDPHQAWLVQRGLKTLPMRVDYAQRGAQVVAEWLEKHPKVEWVKFPGLLSHPQYQLAKEQMDGPGFMISFELKGGLIAGKTLLDSCELCTLAVSLGGIETLIQHPAGMTHSKTSPEKRIAAGISDGLIRLSIGCEDPIDIIDDLKQALDKIL
jgi:methionine-gamma-lyase